MENIILLGASGSIGRQTIDILLRDKDKFNLVGFSVGRRVEKIPEILSSFPNVAHVSVSIQKDCDELRKQYPNIYWHCGDRGLLELIEQCDASKVVNAISGFAGTNSSYKALTLNKTLLLANKESLVVAGDLLMNLVKDGHGKIIPIDSEHVAIAKLLSKVWLDDVDKILITASGGAFRDLSTKELVYATPKMAMKHPTWKMGWKVTLDCATMMNKGFEVIEACHLFGVGLDKIQILMHRESNVHAALLLKDGTYLADVSKPDMHIPIEYALYEGKNDFEVVKTNSLQELGDFHFSKFDPKRYPCVDLALQAYKKGGNACAILTGADEGALYLYITQKISFLDIPKVIKNTIEMLSYMPELMHMSDSSLDDLERSCMIANMVSSGMKEMEEWK